MNDTTSHDDAVEVITIPGIEERMKMTNEKTEADFFKIGNKIHRFPQNLRRIWGEGERYIVPSFVALGPYHHGLPHLKKTEELKHTVAKHLCTKSGHPVGYVYDKVRRVAGEARGCYDEDAVAGFSEDEFADMMFLDGCFLLQYLAGHHIGCPLLINQMVMSPGPCVMRDIMLLENQIPWLVVDALMSFMPVDVHKFIAKQIGFRISTYTKNRSNNDHSTSSSVSRDAAHLLSLARSYLIDGIER